MATNPRFPGGRDDHTHMDLTKRGSRGRQWWPVGIGIVLAALLAAIVWYLPQAPKRAVAPSAATVPPQPTGNLIEFTNVKMTAPAVAGGATNITGVLFNNGKQESINAVEARATFTTTNGQTVSATAPLYELLPGGNRRPFLDHPVEPGGRKPFEMRIDNVPPNWNGNMPAVSIVNVGGEPASGAVPAGVKQTP